jgi:hypothetical protein
MNLPVMYLRGNKIQSITRYQQQIYTNKSPTHNIIASETPTTDPSSWRWVARFVKPEGSDAVTTGILCVNSMPVYGKAMESAESVRV